MDAIEEFMQIYVDQFLFMEYFRDQWLPRLGIHPTLNHILYIHLVPFIVGKDRGVTLWITYNLYIYSLVMELGSVFSCIVRPNI